MGIYLSSGLFQVWLSQGIVSISQLKSMTAACLVLSFGILVGSFLQMHLLNNLSNKKFKTILPHHMSILLGLGSLSWSGHQIHISGPLTNLVGCGVDPSLIPNPSEMLFLKVMALSDHDFAERYAFYGQAISKGFFKLVSLNSAIQGYGLTTTILSAHHIAVGGCFVLSGILFYLGGGAPKESFETFKNPRISSLVKSWHCALAVNLSVMSTVCLLISHSSLFIPVYPHLVTDFPTSFSIFCHHSWISSILIVGASSHLSIAVLSELFVSHQKTKQTSYHYLFKILSHRDILIGHLIWATIFIGLHSFGAYIHNDTLLSLGRLEGTFSDSSIQLKPVFAIHTGNQVQTYTPTYLKLDVYYSPNLESLTTLLGTSDFMVSHIHAFTIHTTVLILVKCVVNARSSRLVSDKALLGFRYPCDGPGRGGTCQISPWDHIYLALFWSYNSCSVIVFHLIWKMQSDVWTLRAKSTDSALYLTHITSGDFAMNSNSINGWLRNFLWSQAASVIQSYSSAITRYGLIFLISHYVWALSLMFIFSGRGYWQELIESLLWSHLKLGVVPFIQPRALSITQGRAVGLCHYMLGGIGCTWSFTLSRLVSLSS
jgi:photosystem I P700 chlorophyll a apoprotein A1